MTLLSKIHYTKSTLENKERLWYTVYRILVFVSFGFVLNVLSLVCSMAWHIKVEKWPEFELTAYNFETWNGYTH